MPWHWSLLVLLVAVLAAPGGVGVTHGLTKLFPDSPVPDGPAPVLELCRGEVGDLQVVVRPEADVTAVSVEPFALTQEASRIQVTTDDVYREHFVDVTAPSGNADRRPHPWPDALIPQRFVRERAAAGRTAVFWLDLRVPNDAAPGDYTGDCTVRLDDRLETIPLTVRVLDLALPVTRHLRANVAMYWRDILLNYANAHWHTGPPWTADDPAYQAICARYYELLLQHRLCAYDLPVPATSPAADRWYADPRVHSLRLPWMDDHGSRATLDAVARARERGVFDKLYYYAADEPQPAAYPSVRDAAAAFHQLVPGVPFVATVAPVPPLYGSVDVWCPDLGNYLGSGYLDPERLAERRALGEGTWWYTCCVPLYPYPTWLVDDDAVAPRASIWLMPRLGLTGFVYSMAHGWSPDPYASVASFNHTNGDGLLLYPGQPYGTEQPFPSLRLKLLRDGLQDAELLRLLGLELEAAGRRRGARFDGAARVRELTSRLFGTPYQLDRSPEALFAARAEAAAELLAAREHDLLTWVTRGPAGAALHGSVRPGTRLVVDGALVEVAADGAWTAAVDPAAPSARLEVGEPARVLDRELLPRWASPAADPPFARVAWAAAEPGPDDPAWAAAPPLTLANGATVRFVADPTGLSVRVEGASPARVVLDPNRAHRAVDTFFFGDEPQVIRRTETGRELLEMTWQVTKATGRLTARVPYPVFGVTPAPGAVWGATVITGTGPTRAAWFEAHGDPRYLPELRF